MHGQHSRSPIRRQRSRPIRFQILCLPATVPTRRPRVRRRLAVTVTRHSNRTVRINQRPRRRIKPAASRRPLSPAAFAVRRRGGNFLEAAVLPANLIDAVCLAAFPLRVRSGVRCGVAVTGSLPPLFFPHPGQPKGAGLFVRLICSLLLRTLFPHPDR